MQHVHNAWHHVQIPSRPKAPYFHVPGILLSTEIKLTRQIGFTPSSSKPSFMDHTRLASARHSTVLQLRQCQLNIGLFVAGRHDLQQLVMQIKAVDDFSDPGLTWAECAVAWFVK